MRNFRTQVLVAAVLVLSVTTSLFAATPSKHQRRSKSKHVNSLRVRKVKRAFVASAELRPMAEQLLDSRTPAAYAGVEKYARVHAKSDEGALAWVALGYAHLLDKQYPESVSALKKAKPRAGVIDDYVDYFLAQAELASGDGPAAHELLRGFDDRNPDSLIARDAAIVDANALLATNRPEAALKLLQAHRLPYRSDLELVLGRAAAKAENIATAAAAFKQIYVTMPTAAEALAAKQEFDQLVHSSAIAPLTFNERKQRAATLVDKRDASDAVIEYRALVAEAPADEQPALTLDLANALSQSGRTKDGFDLVRKMPEPGGELSARRMYYLLEFSRPDPQPIADVITQLRANYPESPWFENALLSAANTYLLRNDYSTASRFYGELATRFPHGKRAAYANWKSAWLAYRSGDDQTADQGFRRELELYPDSPDALSALYWGGRLAEEQHQAARARALYTVAASRFRNDYYSQLARERLQKLGPGEVEDDPVLSRVGDPPGPQHFSLTAPEDNLAVQKSLLLENAGLTDFAARELQSAAPKTGENWTAAQLLRLYTEAGRYDRALQTLKRAAPGYYAVSLSDLPRPFWEGLFPRAYWDQLKKSAGENELDPFLVASLIRQESEFNPAAVSRAQAMGLMQLLPKTGKKLAHELKIRRFQEDMLLDPNTNLQLGARYLKNLLDKYDGQLEYALAAYNAGPDRVDDWRQGHYRDVYEFVESIPFTETREYVQAILRNQEIYSQLYHAP